jgi:hypothetical protein
MPIYIYIHTQTLLKNTIRNHSYINTCTSIQVSCAVNLLWYCTINGLELSHIYEQTETILEPLLGFMYNYSSRANTIVSRRQIWTGQNRSRTLPIGFRPAVTVTVLSDRPRTLPIGFRPAVTVTVLSDSSRAGLRTRPWITHSVNSVKIQCPSTSAHHS